MRAYVLATKENRRIRSAAVPADAGGSRAMRAAGLAAALLFRAVPTSRRFGLAIAGARCLEPLIARTRGYQERARLRTDTLRETSLELLLMMLTRHGTTFDTRVRIEGAGHLPAPRTGPTLIVGPHTMLTALFVRYLEDEGHEALIIRPDPQLVFGTRKPVRVLRPSPDLLLRVRRHFRNGATVAAMIDRGEPERRNRPVATSNGVVFISDALLRVALRSNARVVFVATRMDDASQIVIHLASPARGSVSVDAIVGDFAAFFDRMRAAGAAAD